MAFSNSAPDLAGAGACASDTRGPHSRQAAKSITAARAWHACAYDRNQYILFAWLCSQQTSKIVYFFQSKQLNANANFKKAASDAKQLTNANDPFLLT